MLEPKVQQTLDEFKIEHQMDCESIILGGGNRTSKLILPPAQLLKLPNTEVVENLALVKS